MGRRSRTKGAVAEREVVALAREVGFARAERTAPMQAASGDEHHADVSGVGRLRLEVKRRGKGSMYALAVAATQERLGFVPVLAYREDRGPWLAVLPLAEALARTIGPVTGGPSMNMAEECPRFFDCSCNDCPLDPDAALHGGRRFALKGEERCRAQRASREAIAMAHGHPAAWGLLPREVRRDRRRAAWLALPEDERQRRLAVLRPFRTARPGASEPVFDRGPADDRGSEGEDAGGEAEGPALAEGAADG